MKEDEIRVGDIVEIDYVAEFTKEHINEGKALVVWKDCHQPLVRKLNTRTTTWICYEDIARVIEHIDIEKYIDDALNKAEFEQQNQEIVNICNNICNLADEIILRKKEGNK